MKVLVIPDCHLKPYMFERAEEILSEGIAERAVYLGDTPDDFNSQGKINLYEDTFTALISLVKNHPDTLICYGNHDVSYLWKLLETGYSEQARDTVVRKISELQQALPADNPVRFIHRIDNVLFCHGGLCKSFVKQYVRADYDDVDGVIDEINRISPEIMWEDSSPIWLRPQKHIIKMYKGRKLLQVVGHTPMESVRRRKNVISCDVFSTRRDGTPRGSREFLILDTETWKYVTTP